ncbi:unnamed protein product [Closterium sp. NIES-53]
MCGKRGSARAARGARGPQAGGALAVEAVARPGPRGDGCPGLGVDEPGPRGVLGLASSPGLTSPLLCPPPDQSRQLLPPASPLPAPSPYTEQTGCLTERREPVSRPTSHVRAVHTGRRVPRPRPPLVPGTHHMALRPSSVPQRVPLPSPPASSLANGPDPESDFVRGASPTVPRLLATVVTYPSFECATTSALVAELVDFGAACRLDYAASLEDFECLAAAVPHLVSMLMAPEGDPDAPDIPNPSSYAEAIMGPYSSQWQTVMDAEMASWKSTGTYVDAVPPPGANIVDGTLIFRGVDFFHTFSPTPKMITLQVLLHVEALRNYELHSLDFSTVFLQGSLHEEIWLRRPPGFTGTTLAALGFAPSTADPSLFLRTDTSLPPFYVLVYVDELVFAIADTKALALVKSELQKRHTSTDLGELRSYLGLQITRDRARCTITLTQSHVVHQVLQRFGLRYSSPKSTPLPTSHSLSAPPSDESHLARYVAHGRHRPEHREAAKRVLRYLCSTSGMGLVLGGRGPVLNVDNKAMIALYQEHRLEHRRKHIALRYFFARELE